MSDADDILIIGAGPAGTSAALALAGSGLRVRLLDAGPRGGAPVSFPPDRDLLAMRREDASQWRWQLGEDFAALRAAAGNSPKLRVPGLMRVFEGYARANRIEGLDGFQVVGALAAGGLSNAWGCGVAAFDADELAPLAGERLLAMGTSYARVATRMGLSGSSDDELATLLGVDAWAAPALAVDTLHARLAARHRPGQSDFRLGRARVAVLSVPSDDPSRLPCDLRGLCLWGCPRRSTWSAALDLPAIRRAGIAIEQGVQVHAVVPDGSGWRAEGLSNGAPVQFWARRIVLAAGTLASTRLVLAALPSPPAEVALQSNPTAAFLALSASRLGAGPEQAFGLAQLSFAALADGVAPAWGNLFSTAGLPVSEFLGYLPVSRRAGLPLLRALLPACSVGNVFLPGALSAHRASLGSSGELRVRGGFSDAMDARMSVARQTVAGGLRRAGAWMLPGSFVAGAPGADLHYAATLPMRAAPRSHETTRDGEVAGLPGLFVVDGASLPDLPAKAHTLTIMANADRIAGALVARSP